jgi:hypothetical protein
LAQKWQIVDSISGISYLARLISNTNKHWLVINLSEAFNGTACYLHVLLL